MSSSVSRRRKPVHSGSDIGAHRAKHLDLAARDILTAEGLTRVTVDDSESPLAWLARRKGRDGRAMISAEQYLAGERLRADFTRANMTPRVTANWDAPTGRSKSGGGAGEMTDLIVASRQRVAQAMSASGPEFAGLLMDVCCFLHGGWKMLSTRAAGRPGQPRSSCNWRSIGWRGITGSAVRDAAATRPGSGRGRRVEQSVQGRRAGYGFA